MLAFVLLGAMLLGEVTPMLEKSVDGVSGKGFEATEIEVVHSIAGLIS